MDSFTVLFASSIWASAIPVLFLSSVIEGHFPPKRSKGQTKSNSCIVSPPLSSETNIFNPFALNARALVWLAVLVVIKFFMITAPSLIFEDVSYAIESEY